MKLRFPPSYFPPIVAFMFFTFLLLLPGSAFPKENFFTKIQLDKWVHIGIFSLLVFLFNWASLRHYPEGNKKWFITVGLAMLVYGIAIEFIQHYFVPNRGFELGDILADAGGVILGILISIRRFYKKNRPL